MSDDQLDLFSGRRRRPRPPLPPHNGEPTSRAAAESMRDGAATIRAAVLAAIRAAGDAGMTCDEVEEALHLTHQTASARVNELAKKIGAVRDSGQRRPTRSGRLAVVWVVR